MKITLLVTTYNNPRYLEQTLRSALGQTYPLHEIVVGDDGSTDETRLLVEAIGRSTTTPIHHVWQPDEGFRLAEIRNRAIAQATGDYIIQIDGDLVLHPHFVADHAALAEEGYLLQGSRSQLTEAGTEHFFKQAKRRLTPFSPGVKHRENVLRMLPLCRYLSLRYRNRYPIYYARGCNISFFKADVVAVNGYDESFIGWGHEDSDLTLRLMNNGICKKYLKFGACVFHLYHDESKRVQESPNLALMEQHRKERCTRIVHGITDER